MNQESKLPWRRLALLMSFCSMIVWWGVLFPDSRNRTAFFVRFMLVQKGMSATDVEKLLGESDDRAGIRDAHYGAEYEDGWRQGENLWYWVKFDNQTGKVVSKEMP
jgi:hypothetical protein